MAKATLEDLGKIIKENPVGAYILHGDEPYLKKAYLEKIIKATVDKGFEEFNLKIFDGEQASFDEIIQMVEQLPLMSQSKCVVVKGFTPALIKGKKDELKAVLSDLPEYTCLCFVCPEDLKGEDFNYTLKLFEKYGTSACLSRLTPSDIVKKLNSAAKKYGREFEPGAAAFLVEYVGSDLNTVLNETDKLCAYCDGKITRAHIELLCSGLLETRVFDMTNDIVAGRYEPAIIKLNRLFDMREDEIKILGAIISQYANMMRAKITVSTGHTFAQTIEYYPSYNKKTASLSAASRNASKLSIQKIGQNLEILSEADIKMKTTQENKKILLEKTIIKLIRN